MTVANLIAHQLIGEEFANQLDEAVHHAIDEMLNEESFALESVEDLPRKAQQPGHRCRVETLAVHVPPFGCRPGAGSDRGLDLPVTRPCGSELAGDGSCHSTSKLIARRPSRASSLSQGVSASRTYTGVCPYPSLKPALQPSRLNQQLRTLGRIRPPHSSSNSRHEWSM
jgi:hypothetical protein